MLPVMKMIAFIATAVLVYSGLGILYGMGVAWGAHPILLVPWFALLVLATATLAQARKEIDRD